MKDFQSFESDWKLNVLYYVLGFVANRVKKIVDCCACHEALFHDGNDVVSDVSFAKLLCIKQRGGLVTPSNGTFTVVKLAELISTFC